MTETISTTKAEIRSLPLSAFVLSQTPTQIERRAHFDQDALKKLGATIKADGRPQQLIIARPVGEEKFEIVDGERRFLGAKLAGVERLLTDIRDLTDEQVERIQLVTGLQKEGLHPLAEAEGYEKLHKRGMSVAEIADEVGHSPAYVYARMKLLALCKEARNAFYDGKLTASTALLIARIPVESIQKDALQRVLEPFEHDGDPLSYREVFEMIRRNFMLRLADAPFPKDDDTLLRDTPACGNCPKNTSSQPELFEDVNRRDALCTDPTCFDAKKTAAIERRIEQAEANGRRIIRGKAAKEIARYGTYSLSGGYTRMDRIVQDDPKHRTAAQILGRNAKPDLLVKDGEVVEVIKLSEVKAALKTQGVKLREPTSRGTGKISGSAQVQAQNLRDEIDVETDKQLLLAVRKKDSGKLTGEVLRYVLGIMLEAVFDSKLIETELGFLPSAHYSANVPRLAKLSDAKVTRAIIDAVYLNELDFNPKDPNNFLRRTAKRLKIDEKKIRKEVEASLKADTPATPAKASKKKGTKR